MYSLLPLGNEPVSCASNGGGRAQLFGVSCSGCLLPALLCIHRARHPLSKAGLRIRLRQVVVLGVPCGLLFFLFIIPILQALAPVSFLYYLSLATLLSTCLSLVCYKFMLHLKPVSYASLHLMELLDLHLFYNYVLDVSPGLPAMYEGS